MELLISNLNKYKAIYARQSLEKKDSLSIEGQIDLCRKHVNSNEKFKVYYESKSGKNTTQRLEFLQLMEDIKLGLVSTVIVYRIDRISRNVLDFCNIWDTFKTYNVQFVSCNENFDTSTPMGEAMIMIAMIFAQMERQTIIERVTDNYFRRAEQGFYLGGAAPFGFKKIDIIYKGKKTASLESDELESEILKRMYSTYASTNISLGKLGYELTDEGLRTRKGTNWSTCNIGRVLRSPVYVQADAKVYQYLIGKGAHMNNEVDEYCGVNGCYIYAPQLESDNPIAKKKKKSRTNYIMNNTCVTLAPHQGIIDSDLWLKCQYKLDNNKQIKCDRSGTHSWLSGIMRCENCGYGITVVNNNRGRNYINCYGRKTHACRGREHTWEMYEIEEIASNELLNRLESLSQIEAKEIIPDEPPEINNLRKEIVKLEKRSDNLLDEIETAIEEGSESRIVAIRKRLDQISSALEESNAEVGRLLNESNNRKNNLLCGYSIQDIINNWNTGSFDMKTQQTIARTFIQHVIIGDHDAKVIFY